MSANPNLLQNLSDPSDVDPEETNEWLDALEAMILEEGPERAHYVIERLVDTSRRSGIICLIPRIPHISIQSHPTWKPKIRGDNSLEDRLRSYTRWNAMAMVVKANKESTEYGGHIASFASAVTLYSVGFNHFFHAPDGDHGGDLVFFPRPFRTWDLFSGVYGRSPDGRPVR